MATTLATTTVREAVTVYDNTSHYDNFWDRSYVVGGTFLGSSVGVRSLSDAFSQHDAIDAHRQSIGERIFDGITGGVSVVTTALPIASAANRLLGTSTYIIAPNSGLASTIKGGPINPADLARMQTAFERNGGKILQNADVDGYLRFRGAEGVTDNAKQVLLRSDASRSAVFEEFIHTAQHRTGRFNEAVGQYGNLRGEAFLEIEAAEKLIRNRNAWQLPNNETRQTIERLRNYRNIFTEE